MTVTFKVRPPKGWYAVTWELAIVTLGVLIALGAQQWAEDMAWNARAVTARDALRQEVADHYVYAAEWRMVGPCINAQLDALEQRVLSSGSSLEPALEFTQGTGEDTFVFVLRTPSRPYGQSVWQSTNGTGVSSVMAADERFELGGHYRQVMDVDEENNVIIDLGSQLAVLTKPLPLDPTVRLTLLQQIAAIRGHNRWMVIKASQLIGHIETLGMRASRQQIDEVIGSSGTVKFCRSRGLPVLPLSAALVPLP